MMGLLLLILVIGGGLLFMALGNTEPAVAFFGGAIAGFLIWVLIGFIMLLSSAFDCNSLDADNMCVDYGNGEVRP